MSGEKKFSMQFVLSAVRMQKELSAQMIERELVCCDIYERLEALSDGRVPSPEWMKLRSSPAYHDICFYGAWAAEIVRKGK